MEQTLHSNANFITINDRLRRERIDFIFLCLPVVCF